LNAEFEDGESVTVSFRHSGWQDNRRRVFRSLSRTHQTFSRRVAFKHCGSHAYILRNIDKPALYKVAGSSCHDRFCLPCANERSRRIAANTIELAEGRTLRFVTFTLRSGDEPLIPLLDRLYDSFAKLRRRNFWKKRVTGGLAFLEVKRSSRTQRWHPHLHVIVNGAWLPKQELRKHWLAVTGDSFIVDVRLIRDHAKACRYITKYASKPFNSEILANDTFLDEAVLSLAHRRLIIAFGNWKSVTVLAAPEATAWENVGSLADFLSRASRGCVDCLLILESIAPVGLHIILDKIPRLESHKQPTEPDWKQLSFQDVHGSWSINTFPDTP
jgi:hypothetical protein